MSDDSHLELELARLRQELAENRASERMLRAIIEAIPYPIFLKGKDLRYCECNGAFCAYLGYPREKVIGATVFEVAPRDKAQIYHEADLALLTNGGVQRYEAKVRGADDKDRDILFHKQTYEDESGAVAGMVGIMIDITDRKREEEERRRIEHELQQRQKLESLGVLAGGVAHDFNNILAAILGNLDLARASLPASSSVFASLEAATASVMRASGLTRQMLACAGRAKLTRTTIDVNALIVEMLEMLKALVPKRAKLQFGPGSDLPLVAGDASQLRQVIMNLVINAAEATEGRAVGIEITTSLARLSGRLTDRFVHQDGLEPGDYVAIRVRDDGVGMDAATIQRIFEPFYSTKFAGRGLGLPAVFGIVRGHGGGIRVESSPGAGSTLTAYLPASGAATATAEAPAAAEERAYRGRGTVLLVDDEDLVREVGQRLLRAIGFDVIAAANGREAIERFAAYRDAIVAVVLDLTMPDSDGFEVLRKLRQEDPSVRVVIASGYSQSDVERRYPSSPPAAFLEKPFGLAALREALHAALEK